MNALFLLIPLGVLVIAGAAVALVWAIRNGQFDDLEAASLQPLREDQAPASGDEK